MKAVSISHFGITVLFVLVLLLPATGNEAAETVKKVWLPILNDHAFVQLNANSINWGANDGDSYVPSELPDHPQGVFRMTNITLWKPKGNEGDKSFSIGCSGNSQIHLINPRSEKYNEQSCREVATGFLKRQFPISQPLLDNGELITTPPKGRLPQDQGLFEFYWKIINIEELWDLEVRVSIREVDAKVTEFTVRKRRLPPFIIPIEQVKKSALQFVTQLNRFSDITLSFGLLDAYTKSPRVVWPVIVRALDAKTRLRAKGFVYVDAKTSQIVDGEQVTWRFMEEELQNNPSLDSWSPTWTNQGLIYVSIKYLTTLPDWAPIQPQALLRDNTGQIYYLTLDLQSGSIFTSSLNTGSWLVVQRQRWAYALDFETGTHRILGMPERGGATPTIDPKGKWAVVSGTGRDLNSDLDLLPDDLTARGEQLGIRGRLVSKGDDHHPLFSPDTRWLYFVTTTEQNNKVAHALRRIPAELSHTRSLKKLEPKQIQTILTLPGDVQRLSIYPNGQKLLLQSDKGMFALSVADKKATTIAPKNLKDNEVNAPITLTRDGWAGPSDNEVTFSGKTTDKVGKVRWRIYSCRFDGSGLKAWTPKENQPVEAYKFPKAPDSKTAIDLAKQWALKEIEWEDYLRRQGG